MAVFKFYIGNVIKVIPVSFQNCRNLGQLRLVDGGNATFTGVVLSYQFS